LGEKYNYDLIEIVKYLSKPQDGAEKSFIKESRLNTIRKDFTPYNEMYKQNSKNEELCNYIYETSLLGFSHSYKLFDILKKSYPDIVPINEAKTELDGNKVVIGGQISELRSGTSKNKNKYIKIKLSDGTESFNAMIMEKNFAINDELNNGKKLEESDIVMLQGQKKGDIIFANKIVNQNAKILLKIQNKVDKTIKL
jgi:DNA polymerase III alpha subunit